MPHALLFSDAFSGRFWGLLEFSPFQSEPLYPNGAVVKIIGALGQTPLLTWQFPYHPKGASYFYIGVPRSGLGRRGPFPAPLYPVTMSLSWSKPLLSPPRPILLYLYLQSKAGKDTHLGDFQGYQYPALRGSNQDQVGTGSDFHSTWKSQGKKPGPCGVLGLAPLSRCVAQCPPAPAL